MRRPYCLRWDVRIFGRVQALWDQCLQGRKVVCKKWVKLCVLIISGSSFVVLRYFTCSIISSIFRSILRSHLDNVHQTGVTFCFSIINSTSSGLNFVTPLPWSFRGGSGRWQVLRRLYQMFIYERLLDIQYVYDNQHVFEILWQLRYYNNVVWWYKLTRDSLKVEQYSSVFSNLSSTLRARALALSKKNVTVTADSTDKNGSSYGCGLFLSRSMLAFFFSSASSINRVSSNSRFSLSSSFARFSLSSLTTFNVLCNSSPHFSTCSLNVNFNTNIQKLSSHLLWPAALYPLLLPKDLYRILWVSVHVCEWVRERERERDVSDKCDRISVEFVTDRLVFVSSTPPAQLAASSPSTTDQAVTPGRTIKEACKQQNLSKNLNISAECSNWIWFAHTSSSIPGSSGNSEQLLCSCRGG